MIDKKQSWLYINIVEVKQPDKNCTARCRKALLLDLENRVSFRRAMKQAIGRTMRLGAKRYQGSSYPADCRRCRDRKKQNSYHEGTIPLQTLRADIDYGFRRGCIPLTESSASRFGSTRAKFSRAMLKAAATEKSLRKRTTEAMTAATATTDAMATEDGNRNFNRDAKRVKR